MKKIVKRILVSLLLALSLTAPALADRRTDIVGTVPSAIGTTNSNNFGVGLSYKVVGTKHFEVAPMAVVTSINKNAYLTPGLGVGFTFDRVSFGFAEVLKRGAAFNLQASHYNPTLFVGIRL